MRDGMLHTRETSDQVRMAVRHVCEVICKPHGVPWLCRAHLSLIGGWFRITNTELCGAKQGNFIWDIQHIQGGIGRTVAMYIQVSNNGIREHLCAIGQSCSVLLESKTIAIVICYFRIKYLRRNDILPGMMPVIGNQNTFPSEEPQAGWRWWWWCLVGTLLSTLLPQETAGILF